MDSKMGVLKIVLTVLFIIVCLALVVLVLMQEGKSAGLGSISGAAETYWGRNKGRSMEGRLVKSYQDSCSIVYGDGGNPESESILRKAGNTLVR